MMYKSTIYSEKLHYSKPMFHKLKKKNVEIKKIINGKKINYENKYKIIEY